MYSTSLSFSLTRFLPPSLSYTLSMYMFHAHHACVYYLYSVRIKSFDFITRGTEFANFLIYLYFLARQDTNINNGCSARPINGSGILSRFVDLESGFRDWNNTDSRLFKYTRTHTCIILSTVGVRLGFGGEAGGLMRRGLLSLQLWSLKLHRSLVPNVPVEFYDYKIETDIKRSKLNE